jgi:hypothetical protein
VFAAMDGLVNHAMFPLARSMMGKSAVGSEFAKLEQTDFSARATKDIPMDL